MATPGATSAELLLAHPGVGRTPSPRIELFFRPETGKLVCWNNHRPDGSLNAATLHHGMKVRRGLKYVITKWYRERPWGW